jgi:hypothetical protein
MPRLTIAHRAGFINKAHQHGCLCAAAVRPVTAPRHQSFRSATRLSPRTRRLAILLAALVWPCTAHAGSQLGPQSIVRKFCQTDGIGQRVSVAGWADIAPLVSWRLEPAWDHVVLISGYELGAPLPIGDGDVGIEVRYSVTGHVWAVGVRDDARVEAITFRVHEGADGSWHIAGPPPEPHIFNSHVEIESMQRSLERGGINFIANTTFVWQMFRSAGWEVPLEPTASLLDGSNYRLVTEPKPGDVIVYLRDGSPYHAGLVEAEDQIVSATVNGGIVRTTTNAFPGEVKYLRLVAPAPTPTAGEQDSAAAVAAAPQPFGLPPPVRPRRSPTPGRAKASPAIAPLRQATQPPRVRTVRPQRLRPPTPAAARRTE